MPSHQDRVRRQYDSTTKQGKGKEDPLLQKPVHAPAVTSESQVAERRVGPVSTRDPELIKRWARHHQAEPATGEATASGRSKVNVQDGGAGIRFNFPGLGRYRPISWAEWFDNFDRHQLTFVYDEEGDDARAPSPRYRIVKTEEWRELLEG